MYQWITAWIFVLVGILCTLCFIAGYIKGTRIFKTTIHITKLLNSVKKSIEEVAPYMIINGKVNSKPENSKE